MAQEKLCTLPEAIHGVPPYPRVITKAHNSSIWKVFREKVSQPQDSVLVSPSPMRISTQPMDGDDTIIAVRYFLKEIEK